MDLHKPDRPLVICVRESQEVAVASWTMEQIFQALEMVMLAEIGRRLRHEPRGGLCRFTNELLRRTGRLAGRDCSNEEEVRGFLRTLGARGDVLLRQVAMTELGVLDMKYDRRTDVPWDRNPDEVFAALGRGGELPGADEEFEYRLMIGRTLGCVRWRRRASASS